MRKEVLQDFVVPVCFADDDGRGVAKLTRLLGTAFFIDGNGLFLTARHVMQEHDSNSPRSALFGLNVVSENESPKHLFAKVEQWEGAPAPFDIAVGKVKFRSKSWFEVCPESTPAVWKDVATMGYPETALNTTPEYFNIHMRMMKGYIQRFVKAGELQIRAQHPDCYELSFPITMGMSGAPVFTADNNKQQLVGVCVGSFNAELVDYASSHVEEDGKEFKEQRVKVEQIGLAESIFPLLSWSPDLLEGKSLGEVIRPNESPI